MKLKLKNLGPVEEVNIDLDKNLLVFCGPNNTGKTYVAYAIYGFLIASRKVSLGVVWLPRPGSRFIIKKPFNFEDLERYIESGIGMFKYDIGDIYGLSKDETQKIMGNLEIEIEDLKSSYERYLNSTIDSDFNSRDISYTLRKEKGSRTIVVESERELIPPYETNTVLSKNVDITRNMIGLPNSFHFFAVERNSLYTFSKELLIRRNEFVDQLQNASQNSVSKLIAERTTRYPLAIRDGLRMAEDMLNIQKRESSFKALAEEIENQILDGRLTVGKYGEALFVPNKAKANPLPIHLAASLTKTLASLVFYLKHMAEPKDLIIIDEPELNLHPDNQLKITRVLAKLVNHGFKVIMSTHSDYIIREVNNLIMLNTNQS